MAVNVQIPADVALKDAALAVNKFKRKHRFVCAGLIFAGIEIKEGRLQVKIKYFRKLDSLKIEHSGVMFNNGVKTEYYRYPVGKVDICWVKHD